MSEYPDFEFGRLPGTTGLYLSYVLENQNSLVVGRDCNRLYLPKAALTKVANGETAHITPTKTGTNKN